MYPCNLSMFARFSVVKLSFLPKLSIIPLIPSSLPSITTRPFSSAKSSLYRRPARGLYASKRLSHGNTRSPFNNATRRQWRPNTQYCRLYSETLKEQVRVRCTTTALRQIDGVGGVDAYVLGLTEEELRDGALGKGERTFAQELKARIIAKRLELEREMDS